MPLSKQGDSVLQGWINFSKVKANARILPKKEQTRFYKTKEFMERTHFFNHVNGCMRESACTPAAAIADT